MLTSAIESEADVAEPEPPAKSEACELLMSAADSGEYDDYENHLGFNIVEHPQESQPPPRQRKHCFSRKYVVPEAWLTEEQAYTQTRQKAHEFARKHVIPQTWILLDN